MARKKKVGIETYERIKTLELKVANLKQLLDPNQSIGLFSTDFTVSGIVPLVLGEDIAPEITGRVEEFFQDFDSKLKTKLHREYKKLEKEIKAYLPEYDTKIPKLIKPEEKSEEDVGEETAATGN